MVDTVEYRVQNAILTTSDSIVAAKIDLSIQSLNASSGQDATIVIATSQRWEQIGIKALLENASENKNVLNLSFMNDEARNNVADKVSEFSVVVTCFDWQSLTHHTPVAVAKFL